MTSIFGFKRLAPAALALTALTLASCLSEMPRFPTMPAAPTSMFVPSFIPVVSAIHAAAKKEAKPNGLKYRDTGIKPAVGRAGGLEMAVRALLGNDGITVVEATSGNFDSPSEAVFDKITVKLLDTDLPSIDDRPDAPTWSGEIRGLVPGDRLQVKANLKALEGRRTVVLDVVAPVARRPDIATVTLTGPAQTRPNESVIFFATIRELNGEMGARANCTLFVDGTAVDEATGIWVDKNGVVRCQFAYLFATAGNYTVAVTASAVAPGDWDVGNNTASHLITVVDPGTPIGFGQLTASDENYTYATLTTRTGPYPITGDRGGAQVLSTVNVSGRSIGAIPGPLQGVTARISADGTTIFETTLTPTGTFRYTSGGAVVDCSEYRLDGQYMLSCAFDNPAPRTDSASFAYDHSSGTVTYYGQTLYCNTQGCNTYLGDTGSTTTGTGQPYGVSATSLLRVQLSFVDAAGQPHVIDRSVAFQDLSGTVNYDTTSCAPYFDGLGVVCTRMLGSGTLWRGITTW